MDKNPGFKGENWEAKVDAKSGLSKKKKTKVNNAHTESHGWGSSLETN